MITSLKYELEKLNSTLENLVGKEEYLTRLEAAEFLKVASNFFYKREVQDRIPHIKVGNILRFKKSDLIKYLESGYVTPNPVIIEFKKEA